jgi:apolipoprotein D and lipocalin family protein
MSWKKLSVYAFSLLLMLLMVTACSSSQKIKEMNLAENVDLDRYVGTWYEIARFPHSFEKGLVGVTATYTLKVKGMIEVVNQGYKDSLDGELSRAVGKAKVAKSGNPAHLRVSFFWIFYADYLILELDADYQYVLIGSSSDKYLWILAREPQLDEETYTMLVAKARERGYDVSKLQRVPQKVE